MRSRIALGVTAVWLLVALIIGAQAALAASMAGDPVPLGMALRGALLQTVPWIPATLAVIALAVRFPLQRGRWAARLPIHLLAAVTVAFGVNLLVVLGFWAMQSSFAGLATLVRQAGYWTAVRLHVALVVYAAIGAIAQAALYYRDARERELHLARVEAQLTRARLQALNAQIRPHFLFNTLHTIGQLWRSGRSDDADAVLDHLGSLFHKVQHSTSTAEVPLADELEVVREYLSIEEVRFRDRLAVQIHTTVEALECMVPPLLLQPIIENAVRHGISSVSSSGLLEVRAWVEDERLLLTVRDDGPGFQAAPATRGSGTGLRNTRERLEELYGADAGVRVVSGNGEGTVVTIEMPAREMPIP